MFSHNSILPPWPLKDHVAFVLCPKQKKKTLKLWCFEAKSRGSVRGKGLLPDVEAGTTKTWTAAAADLGRGTLLSFMVPCCLVTLLGGGAEAKLDLKHQPIFFFLFIYYYNSRHQEQSSLVSPAACPPPENKLPLSSPLLQKVNASLGVTSLMWLWWLGLCSGVNST